ICAPPRSPRPSARSPARIRSAGSSPEHHPHRPAARHRMRDLASRYDTWHVILTAAPLVAAAFGALVVRRWPGVLGRTVALYALLCIGIALAPLWLGAVTSLPDAGGRR